MGDLKSDFFINAGKGGGGVLTRRCCWEQRYEKSYGEMMTGDGGGGGWGERGKGVVGKSHY